jgi:nucleotide-binding universal stress UspA family protein
MEESQMRRFKVVVALDASERAEAVLEYGLDQASRHDRSELHVITVAERGEQAVRAAEQRLVALVKFDVDTFVHVPTRARRTRLHVRSGDPAEEIVELVHEVEADLLVIGGTVSTGRRPRLGEVAERVIGRAPCVVMVVRVPDYGSHPLRERQCQACVAVRAGSDGEHWFCHAHSASSHVRAIV